MGISEIVILVLFFILAIGCMFYFGRHESDNFQPTKPVTCVRSGCNKQVSLVELKCNNCDYVGTIKRRAHRYQARVTTDFICEYCGHRILRIKCPDCKADITELFKVNW